MIRDVRLGDDIGRDLLELRVQGSDLDVQGGELPLDVGDLLLYLAEEEGAPAHREFDERIHHDEDESANAESFLLKEAALGSLQDCLEALPLEFREVIILRELEELSYKEVSEIARVPVGTVMSRLARARKRLQECLTGALK